MEKNINAFGKEFEEIVLSCVNEEGDIRKFKKDLEEKLATLDKNNSERIKKIDAIRRSKISEIDEAEKQTDDRIKELNRERDNILSAYCKIHHHKMVNIKSEYLGSTGKHSFGRGFSSMIRFSDKCKVCGYVNIYTTESYGRNPSERYVREIPNDAYDDASLSTSGKTLREVESEISELHLYKRYLDFLHEELCRMFGHDAQMESYSAETFKCKCCGRLLDYREYINDHHRASFKKIVPYHYEDIYDKEFITAVGVTGSSDLPSFDDYKVLIKKREEESK